MKKDWKITKSGGAGAKCDHWKLIKQNKLDVKIFDKNPSKN